MSNESLRQYQQSPRKYDERIECVIVCLNYSDFLAETLPFNLPHIDRMVVVTSHGDRETRDICAKWSVECVPTDVFSEGGGVFNKGAAINIGMGACRQTGWMMTLDADIALPATFRNMLFKAGLQEDCIYGATRHCVHSAEDWARVRHKIRDEPQFGWRYLVDTPAEAPIGATLVHKERGFCPIGYFALWHSRYMHENEIRYPEVQGTAENMDVQWALRWPRAKRILLPTVRVFHIDSEQAPMGANWDGRTTKEFRRYT
jgi:hypothetical protein